MKKSALILACLVAAPVSLGGAAHAAESKKSEDIATAAVGVSTDASVNAGDYKGDAIYSSDGRRLGAVYSATGDGSAQLIVGAKMVTIPASTLSVVDENLTTSLTRKDVMKLR